MEHTYTPLSTVETPSDQDNNDGLFETKFDQYESANRLFSPPSPESGRSSTTSTSLPHETVPVPAPAVVPKIALAPAPKTAQANAQETPASKPATAPLKPNSPNTLSPEYNFLVIPSATGRSREASPIRGPSPGFPFERCVTPGTVQGLLQQEATLDYTQSEEYGANAGDLWQSNNEITVPSCWQRIRRPLARAIGIVTAIMLSGCAGEMCALGAVWRGASTAVAAFVALVLDALWAAEALAAVAGPPPPLMGAIRRAARRARTPFYALVALLLIVEGVGTLRWAAVALSILAAAMRAAAWCGRRTQRSGLLIPHNRSFTMPAVHYDAQFDRSYSPAPAIRTPMPSYPNTPVMSRAQDAFSQQQDLLRSVTPVNSRPSTPILLSSRHATPIMPSSGQSTLDPLMISTPIPARVSQLQGTSLGTPEPNVILQTLNVGEVSTPSTAHPLFQL